MLLFVIFVSFSVAYGGLERLIDGRRLILENKEGVKWKCPVPYTIDEDVENPQAIEDALNYIEKVTRWSFLNSSFPHNSEYLHFMGNKDEKWCFSENVGVAANGKPSFLFFFSSDIFINWVKATNIS